MVDTRVWRLDCWRNRSGLRQTNGRIMGPHSHVVTAARPDERRSAMTGPTNKDEWRRHIRATSVPIPADVATAVQTCAALVSVLSYPLPLMPVVQLLLAPIERLRLGPPRTRTRLLRRVAGANSCRSTTRWGHDRAVLRRSDPHRTTRHPDDSRGDRNRHHRLHTRRRLVDQPIRS